MSFRSTWTAAARRLTGRAPARGRARPPRSSRRSRGRTGIPFDLSQWIVAAGWAGWSAFCAAALTPPSANPILVACLAAVGGGAAGTAFAIWMGPGEDKYSALLFTLVPALAALFLRDVGFPGHGRTSGTDLVAYFDGCLAGTPYDENALLLRKIEPDTITLQPESGPEIRFARINPRPPDSDFSQPPDAGIVPADADTRRILGSFGCR